MPSVLAELERAVPHCTRCPELRRYCKEVARTRKRAYADWTYHGRPVPGFGDHAARVLIVGLAPGAHGSNRTGRMFTGDGSGEWLYRSLHRAGFANQPHATHAEDGLRLQDVYITAAVRCAPPANKPTPAERANCLPYLARELDAMTSVRVIVTLGKLADDTIAALLRERGAHYESERSPFAHGALRRVTLRDGRPLAVLASYHPSRQNTNTGKLTAVMLDTIFVIARSLVQE